MAEGNERLLDCHRLILSREWLGARGTVNWIMLNPSTADEHFDDPTIRKCVGFSKRWGLFSRMTVTNLFSFRATHPEDLKELVKVDYARAVGYADGSLEQHARDAGMVIAAWGNHGNLAGRAEDVLNRVLPDTPLYCIGLTRAGFPLHPCMAAYTDKPVRFR